MNNKLTVITIITIIIIFGLVGSKAFFHHGFYTSHDGEHQLVRQYIFDQGLRDGQVPVRFSRQLYNGYGYPLFMFTYCLPFYAGEVFRLAGFSFADSVKTVFLIAYILSGLVMFWFARRWGNFAGVMAAVLYMWAPYRFSVMFVRAALGEHAAAVFVPLLFGSISSGKKVKINVVSGVVAIAGLFLSLAMMVQIVLLMFIPWAIGNWWLSKEKKYFVRRLVLMLLLGVGLAAYYLVPAAAYRGLTQKLNPNYFSDHFVTLRQLVYSPWGYTFSMKGTENDGMSFQIGIAQWLIVGLAIFVCLKRILLAVLQGESLKETSGALVMVLIFFLSIFLMTEKSAFAWNRWKNYINIDMPWRFLLMTTFAASALAAVSFKSLTFAEAKGMPLLAIVFLGLSVYTNRIHLRVNEYFDYPDSRLAKYRGTSNSDNEYRPKWDDGGIANTISKEAVISQGSGDLTVIRNKSNLLEL